MPSLVPEGRLGILGRDRALAERSKCRPRDAGATGRKRHEISNAVWCRRFAAAGHRADAGAGRRHDLRARAQCRQRSRRTGCCTTAITRATGSRALKEINTDSGQEPEARVHGGVERIPERRRATSSAISKPPRSSRTASCMCRTAGARSMRSTSSSGRKGTIRWKIDPGTDRAWAGDVACCGVNNRGVALWKDKVISIALDGRMFAINKATGEKVWERKIADPALGETLTIAPLIIRDLAIVGAAGGEFGIRGYIDATDLNTGKPRGAPTPFPARASPATRPGRTARSVGSTAAARCGRPRPTIPTATPSTRASAMPAPTGMPNTVPATTNGRRACSPSARPTARSSGASSTPPTIPMISTRSPSIPSSTPRSTARIASWWCMPPATASSMRSTAPTARSSPASNMSTS